MAHTLTPRTKVLTRRALFRAARDTGHLKALLKEHAFHRSGYIDTDRAVAKFLPNKKGYRYERGKLIPRHAK